MKSHRENPEGAENQRDTKQAERENFALQMQATIRKHLIDGCCYHGQDSRLMERVAQLIAHRAVGNQESDPQNGKIPGYCAVCQVPWPCPVSLRPVVFTEPANDAAQRP